MTTTLLDHLEDITASERFIMTFEHEEHPSAAEVDAGAPRTRYVEHRELALLVQAYSFNEDELLLRLLETQSFRVHAELLAPPRRWRITIIHAAQTGEMAPVAILRDVFQKPTLVACSGDGSQSSAMRMDLRLTRPAPRVFRREDDMPPLSSRHR